MEIQVPVLTRAAPPCQPAQRLHLRNPMELDHTFHCSGTKHVCSGLPSWCPLWPLCMRSRPGPQASASCVLTTNRSTVSSMRSVTSDLERQRPATSRQTKSVNFIETELTVHLLKQTKTMENKAEEVLRHGSHCQLLKNFDSELHLPSAFRSLCSVFWRLVT